MFYEKNINTKFFENKIFKKLGVITNNKIPKSEMFIPLKEKTSKVNFLGLSQQLLKLSKVL